jgi:hypothetical protein
MFGLFLSVLLGSFYYCNGVSQDTPLGSILQDQRSMNLELRLEDGCAWLGKASTWKESMDHRRMQSIAERETPSSTSVLKSVTQLRGMQRWNNGITRPARFISVKTNLQY